MRHSYIGIIRDHSASMAPHARLAMDDYNQVIKGIKEAATEQRLPTTVSVVECGVGYRAQVITRIQDAEVNSLREMRSYLADGDGTPLLDSVEEVIDLLQNAPGANKPESSFLVIAETDGQENRSRFATARGLSQKIKLLQGTDKWSFTFRVPVGYAKALSDLLGVPMGNILEWEQTEEGFARSAIMTSSGVANYLRGVATGEHTSTSRFYSELAPIKRQTVKKALNDVSDRIKIWVVDESPSVVIKPFCERMSGQSYVKGSAFYQVVKPETVQGYKELAIYDQRDGKFYMGSETRALLGFPEYGNIRLIPGNHGRYDLFVQSTSFNRVIPYGCKVLYLYR